MRRQILILAVFLAAFTLSAPALYAFENKKTHPAITERAVAASTIDDYLKTQLGLTDGINAQLSYNFPAEMQDRIMRAQWLPEETNRPVLEWLKVGSAIEDEDGDKYPIRARHHFYDPTRNAGLNNKDDNPDWHGWPNSPFKSFDLTGQSALTWAVDGTASQKPTTNNQAWQSSRTDFYNSLTQPVKSDREKYLGMTFLDLGCILHMIEDMGVPAHTRNDFLFAHYRKSEDYGEPLERWIEIMIPSGGSLERWIAPGWTPTPQVFSKVSNYFDADVYTGNYLGDGVPTPGTWGLSERTNYQFLSWTTIFNDNPVSSLYYFTNPAKIHTAEVNESGRVYLSGYGIDHLARQTMSYDHLRHDHLDKAWCVLGEAIYDDYAEVSLPRTVNYVTGLANYFFRGRLSTTARCVECNVMELTITNQSINSGVQQTLKGGTFEIYWDNPNSNRTQITDFVIDGGWTSSSTLAYNASIIATFIKPAGASPVKYVIVYKGNICENPANTDSDDENAIATTITPPPDNCCVISCQYCEALETPSKVFLTFSGIENCECVDVYHQGPDIPDGIMNNSFILCQVSSCKYQLTQTGNFGRLRTSPKDCLDETWINFDERSISCYVHPTGRWIIEMIFHVQGASPYDWKYAFYGDDILISSKHCLIGGTGLNKITESGGAMACYSPGICHFGQVILETNLTTSTWQENHIYSIGERVIGTNGYIYNCILSHTSAMDNRPITGTNWAIYWFIAECS